MSKDPHPPEECFRGPNSHLQTQGMPGGWHGRLRRTDGSSSEVGKLQSTLH